MISGQAEASQAVAQAAPAKLNLTLRITGKRDDGYHLLDSLVCFAACGDRVTARHGMDAAFTISGPFSGGLAEESDNLVLRAARALADAASVPASLSERTELHLEKNLPVASGIGGGSADAAATLRALASLWDIALTPERMQAVALSLGADVPVCLAGQATRMRGIGEILELVAPLPEAALVLVNPGVPCPTGPVFKARRSGFSAPLDPPSAWQGVEELAAMVRRGGNDLEEPAARLCPPVATALAALKATPGCLAAAMSGSGATCFGLFATDSSAEQAAITIGRAEPGWWVTPTRIA